MKLLRPDRSCDYLLLVLVDNYTPVGRERFYEPDGVWSPSRVTRI